jgi:hypothetical protein
VGRDELDALGVPAGDRKDAAKLAARLNRGLEEALGALSPGRPFAIRDLYAPGSRAGGKGRGVCYHTPMKPAEGRGFPGPPPRPHFDPRDLPPGLVQVVGHVKDERCRNQLADWCDPGPARPGVLRHLVVEGERVEYRHGTPPPGEGRSAAARAAMIFTDGGMNGCPLEAYELLDLDSRAPLAADRPQAGELPA